VSKLVQRFIFKRDITAVRARAERPHSCQHGGTHVQRDCCTIAVCRQARRYT
jgi:hypothetical protein